MTGDSISSSLILVNMMNILLTAIFILLISLNCFAKPIQQTNKIDEFQYSLNKIPQKYSGSDPLSIFYAYKNGVDKLEKGEFETKAEYLNRISNKNLLFYPIKKESLYSISTNNLFIKYDADGQYYDVSYFCTEAQSNIREIKRFAKNTSGNISCESFVIGRKQSSYLGSNQYGASARVTRIDESLFDIYIKKINVFGKGFSQSAYSKTIDFNTRIDIARDVAMKNKNKHIYMLYVFSIDTESTYKPDTSIQTPDIEYPTDRTTKTYHIPINLKYIIFYLYEDGTVLKTIEF